MDVLTDVLNEMYLSGEVVARFDVTAPWGIRGKSAPPIAWSTSMTLDVFTSAID